MKQASRWIVTIAFVALTMVGYHLSAQTAAPKPKPVVGQQTQPSDQDLNIRAYIELLRTDVKSQAKSVLAEVMNFSGDEAEKFWPIYREYEQEISKQGDKKFQYIMKYADNYESMTDAFADEMAKAALDLEQARHDLKAQYYERIKKALGARLAARFLQVDNQILMLIDLQIAASLPIVK
jgi:hypothetical protein